MNKKVTIFKTAFAENTWLWELEYGGFSTNSNYVRTIGDSNFKTKEEARNHFKKFVKELVKLAKEIK